MLVRAINGVNGMSEKFPRRCQVNLYTPAEKAISEAMAVVEDAGCDPLLTDAVCLLSDAKDKVADFVDGVPREEPVVSTKTLENTKASQAKDNVPDIKFYGDGDMFKCISKAWSKEQGWMKSTKAMNVPGGIVVQVSTQQGDNVAEAVCFVPGCFVDDTTDGGYKIIAIAVSVP